MFIWMKDGRSHVMRGIFGAVMVLFAERQLSQLQWCSLPYRPRGARHLIARASSASESQSVDFEHDVVGDFLLPRPYTLSSKSSWQLWEDLGVKVSSTATSDGRRLFDAQPQSRYRQFGDRDEGALRDMQGGCINASGNPGIRVELDFVSKPEEQLLVRELLALADDYGFAFASEEEELDDDLDDADDEDDGDVVRITGRDESQPEESLAPWGYGVDFDKSQLPTALAQVVERIESLPGYTLGPLRDVTVNVRRSVDYQMGPHIDPLGDGPNTFVLSLISGAVVTFSPVTALRADTLRANDEAAYCMHSFTDDDIDCFAARRSLYHMAGEARYVWTHAIRPPLVQVEADGFEAFERWGTWDMVLRRSKNRIAVIFAFADPYSDSRGVNMATSDF